MTDLNEWRLEYPGVSFDFGTLASTFPFSAQVEFGDTDSVVEDTKHPTADGTIMGKDTLGGFDMTFTLTTVPEFPIPDSPWRSALDLFSAFKAKWRADAVRLNPGEYATLTNLDRNRLVYGRPRKCTPKNARLRKGQVEYVSTFQTNGPNFYSATENLALITPIPVSSGGFGSPLRSPLSTEVGTVDLAEGISNDGDMPSWPVLEFHGPGKAYSFELLDGVNSLWQITIPDAIAYDEILVVDTRPWSRGAVIGKDDGGELVDIRPANGLIRGTQLELCTIPVGEDFSYRFRVTDRSGTAFAVARSRDAYAGM